jgi:phosphoribosylformimino-5-aminoimidazole carboxamide ribotide isomerase
MRSGTLEVIPAVDVLGTEAVRLDRGDYDRVTLRAGAPLGLVRRFSAAGARLIHLVDLDGARTGRIRSDLVRAAVSAAAGVPLQASGGVRSVADAQELVAAGAARVVVGTAAFGDGALPGFVDALGERLVVALDVRDGAVAVAGWTRSTGIAVEEAADRCAAAGVRRLLCTAVERDGTLAGPDLDLLARVRERFAGPLLAAGGIRSTAHLAAVASAGAEGAIVGRALLDGSLPLGIIAA